MSDLLTTAEADALARYEAKVEQGLASFMETGTALLHIRDERLYRATHGTFEDYLRERWNISRRRGYELMAGAETVAAVCAIAHTPHIENEAQARAIAPVVKEHGPERAAEVLREVAASGPVTAAAITQASRPATITTRTTETTEVVDLATGEILSEDVTAEVWEAEHRPTITEILAADPDVRAQNLRHRMSAWIRDAHEINTLDPAEMARIAPDMADRLDNVVGYITRFAESYSSAIAQPTPLRVIKEA